MFFTIVHVNVRDLLETKPYKSNWSLVLRGLIFVPSWKLQLKPDEEESILLQQITPPGLTSSLILDPMQKLVVGLQ